MSLRKYYSESEEFSVANFFSHKKLRDHFILQDDVEDIKLK